MKGRFGKSGPKTSKTTFSYWWVNVLTGVAGVRKIIGVFRDRAHFLEILELMNRTDPANWRYGEAGARGEVVDLESRRKEAEWRRRRRWRAEE